MTRWHRESCSNPVIIVEQGVPSCKSCNASPDLKAIISAQSAERLSPSAIPPDEPPGQLNLWWPPCVPYASETPDAEAVVDGCLSDSVPKVDSSVIDTGNLHRISRDPVYPWRLHDDNIRLMRLTPVTNIDAPVHVELEIHDDKRYPDYETVSYTWGGENGDSTLCQPVYVGRYWDVLVQTSNCWEMLRYLRPRRDVRVVWVDAICINQRDLQERERQVAKMGLIFKCAIRTVVYLGPDLVLPTSASSPYPRRHYLQELDILSIHPPCSSYASCMQHYEHVTLATLLQREYFQRIWVIQELILSRDVTFSIGDVEFTIDRQSGHLHTPELRSIRSSNINRVPWFNHITQGVLHNRAENALLSAMELASGSKSSDPRDKIFGVLGMIQNTSQLTPSYAISFQHLAIGYFAYCLVVKKDIRVIVHAAGLQGSARMPSWAPPVHKVGTNDHDIPRLEIDEGPSMFCSRDFISAYKRHHSYDSPSNVIDPSVMEDIENPLQGRASFGRWNANNHSQICWVIRCEQEAQYLSNLQDRLSQVTNEDNCANPSQDWLSHVRVDTHTGALLNLTAHHIICFGQSGLSLVETHHDGSRHTYVFRNGTSSLLVYAQEECFELPTHQSETHLFALGDAAMVEKHPWRRGNSRLCILRSAVDKDAFQLVSANVDICFHIQTISRKSYESSEFGTWNEAHIKNMSSLSMRHVQGAASPTVIPTIKREVINQLLGDNHWAYGLRNSNRTRCHQMLFLERLYWNLSSFTQDFKRRWLSQDNCSLDCLKFLNFGGDIYPPHWASLAFPAVTDPGDYLRVLHAAFLLESGAEVSGNSFIELYLNLVNEFNPRIYYGRSSIGQRLRTMDPLWVTKGLLQMDLRDHRWMGDAASEPATPAVGPEILVELCFEPHQFVILTEVLDLATRVEFQSKLESIFGSGHGIITPSLLGVDCGDARAPQDDARAPQDDLVVHSASRLELLTKSILDHLENFNAEFRRRMATHVVGESICDDNTRDLHGQTTFAKISQKIHTHQGETIRILFDLQMLILWAQLHPCTEAFRARTPYCRNGESELDLLLRDPTEEDANVIVPRWPQIIKDDFGLDKSVYIRKITIV